VVWYRRYKKIKGTLHLRPISFMAKYSAAYFQVLDSEPEKKIKIMSDK
jgi:hypothetical protein